MAEILCKTDENFSDAALECEEFGWIPPFLADDCAELVKGCPQA